MVGAVCLLALAGWFGARAPGQGRDETPNLLANGGFEAVEARDGRDWPTGWASRRPADVECATPGREGGRGLVFRRGSAIRPFVFQEMALKPGWHRLTAFTRSQGQGLALANLQVLGARGWSQDRSGQEALSAEWRRLELTFLADQKASKAQVRLVAWPAQADVLFDDTRLEAIAEPPADQRSPRIPPLPEALRQPSPTVPGEVVVERSTHHCLGFEWWIEGDFNRNGAVETRYRRTGEADWRQGHPMLRVFWEETNQDNMERDWPCPNLYAGSIVDLEPGAEYEVELRLTDPDGGNAERAFMARTRPWPKAADSGRRVHVYPPDFAGRPEAPAVTGLAAAYASAEPGDILMVHAGRYVAPAATRGFVFNRKGAPERPIVIRAAGDGEAVLDGAGVETLVNATGGDHNILEGLTLRNAERLIYSAGSTGLAVLRCRLEKCRYGVMAMTSECLDCTISDNVIIGEMPPAEWVFREESRKKYGETHGVVVYGQGHVVSFNRVACFWDGIDIGGYYEPPDDPRKRACSIDFHNNHVSECMDDCIEMDYGVHNIRVYRNFLANALMGVSTQPLHGGPGYIFRNVIFNVSRAAFKLNCWPAGVLAYHNTCINPFAFRLTDMWQNSRLMNNVALGHEDVESGAIWTGTPTPETSLMDYNGYRDNGKRLLWSYARPRKQPDGRDLHHWVCRDLAEFARGSGQEAHGVWGVDYDAFVKAGPATGKHAASPDLDARLREGAKAIDRGARIPNFNDGFRGDAPDLGAVEFGEPLPRFGPRP